MKNELKEGRQVVRIRFSDGRDILFDKEDIDAKASEVIGMLVDDDGNMKDSFIRLFSNMWINPLQVISIEEKIADDAYEVERAEIIGE